VEFLVLSIYMLKATKNKN